jgi:hypothetical protein
MYRKSLFLLIACLAALPIFAEPETMTATALPVMESKARGENPEIAYNLFSNWADNYQTKAKKTKAITQGILFSSGALFAGGAALAWYGGDSISENCNGSPMDYEDKRNLTMGLGITSGALLVTGLIVHAVPIKDYRAIYADVFQEKDPEVREAMAVSVLRYQADRGKEGRIANFIWSCAVPLFVGAVAVGVNVSNDDKWSKDLLKTMGNSSWGMAGGVVSLFTKSPEERLYERYLNTRDAYYGANR